MSLVKLSVSRHIALALSLSLSLSLSLTLKLAHTRCEITSRASKGDIDGR